MNAKKNGSVLEDAWNLWHIFEPYVKGHADWAPIEPKVIEAAKRILSATEPQIQPEEQDPMMTEIQGPIDGLADEFMGALTGLDGLQGSIIQECLEHGETLEKLVMAAKIAVANALSFYVKTCYLGDERV